MEGTLVCQTEDSIRALLDKLVKPKLPANFASQLSFVPCQSDEEVMAKQIHAVVLLYNYYHRRQHQELEFVNFQSFRQLVLMLMPSVMPYLNDTQLVHQEKKLSLTAKKIVDACLVAYNLDASQVTPTVHESDVSKVAVLLVDSEKQNALLQFGSVTEGVWSVIEKEVNKCNLTTEKSTYSMDSGWVWVSGKRTSVLTGPAKREGSITEAFLKKTATLAVNEATGIPQDELAFLESHVVYSTSKEFTATQFYIVQCTKADSYKVPHVPIKDLIKSLQGPLFSRSSSQWTTTPVVDYFHLLPYARILANWSNSASRYSKNSKSSNVNAKTTAKQVESDNGADMDMDVDDSAPDSDMSLDPGTSIPMIQNNAPDAGLPKGGESSMAEDNADGQSPDNGAVDGDHVVDDTSFDNVAVPEEVTDGRADLNGVPLDYNDQAADNDPLFSMFLENLTVCGNASMVKFHVGAEEPIILVYEEDYASHSQHETENHKTRENR